MVALSPDEVYLDTEDTDNGTVCAQLLNPDVLERDVVFRFTFGSDLEG